MLHLHYRTILAELPALNETMAKYRMNPYRLLTPAGFRRLSLIALPSAAAPGVYSYLPGIYT
jgi:hypothetical protein